MIDTLKRRIKEAHRLADASEKNSDDELRSVLGDIAHELHGEVDALEDIRSANLALRNAAEYWEEKAKQLESDTAT